MKMSIVALCIFLVTAYPLHAEDIFEGDVYLQGTNKGLLIFKQRNGRERDGEKIILRHIYTTPSGELSALEEVVYVKGKLAAYTVEMPDSPCGCSLVRRQDTIVFSFTRGDGGSRESAFTENIVMGPTLTDFIVKNWNALAAGKPVYFNLPAMNLQRVAEFQLIADPQSPYAREGVIVLKMKIANYFLRLLVDPVDLVLDVKTKRMLEIHGKSLLTRRVNGKLENPVVDIYYRYR